MSFLMKVREKIGKPVKFDEATSLVSRDHFVHLCVEINLEKPMISKFQLRRKIREIEYEDIHLVCFGYSKFNL